MFVCVNECVCVGMGACGIECVFMNVCVRLEMCEIVRAYTWLCECVSGGECVCGGVCVWWCECVCVSVCECVCERV